MNQRILFPDLHHFDHEKQAVCFQAQQSGALIACFIRVEDLEKRTQSTLPTKQAILAAFCEYRFDLEELAESAIEDEDFNADDEIWIC
ncbi:DUF1488 domain-containing protein [Grimontia hollisae]|uniref:DUF1488 domain-containing protein n=1 Tax=Grimontia hollisae TaxID=673 RepID=UPI0023DA2234|nr:DUF1488 domain-containing protein [Grimontia hollisae]MDF2183626.1 DUF1488 domain-containing protein [Grimontia hollisae]